MEEVVRCLVGLVRVLRDVLCADVVLAVTKKPGTITHLAIN